LAQAAIIVRVLRRGSRVQQLLAALSERLGLDPLEPDEGGLVVVRMDGRPPQAWERVREGLDAAGPDWREWLHLSPRPNR
jgi:predicted Rdx family selenoprotein